MNETTLPLAIQLYSLRELKDPLDSILAMVAQAGYRAVETVGTQGATADELKSLLNKHGLKVASSHVSLEALQEGLASVAEFQRAVGNHDLVVPWLPRHLYDDSSESWQTIGGQLDDLGQRCKEYDMRLHYHNHAFEMTQVDGKLGIEWLLGAADPENLGFEPDIAWMVRGGVDPVGLLERYAGRCSRVHVKDIAPEGENQDEDGWADVGSGTLDWAQLLPAAKRAGAVWYIVEHDRPKDPKRTVQTSADYLRQRLAGLA